MKKYQNFFFENFHFLVVKFSVYLNRLVFVMIFDTVEELVMSTQNIWSIFDDHCYKQTFNKCVTRSVMN